MNVRDALAEVRAGREAWASLRGERLRLARYDPCGELGSGDALLVKVRPPLRVAVGMLMGELGPRFKVWVDERGFAVWRGDADVLARVPERHPG